MPTILQSKSIYYNDVNLLAQPTSGKLRSRKQVPVELDRIIVAPMESIVGEKFVIEAAKLGLSVMLPRFLGRKQLELYEKFYENSDSSHSVCFYGLGLKDFKEELKFLKANEVRDFGIDIANGGLNLSEELNLLKKYSGTISKFYIGNINNNHTLATRILPFEEICEDLFVRVGIGGGSPCSSSDMTGINRGNITEIMECKSQLYSQDLRFKVNICADGGISKPGYACKAFAAGADYLIMGGYFKNAEEAETNVTGDGTYWGGASQKQLSKIGQTDKHSEGKVLEIKEEKKPLSELVRDLWGGISSYVSYSGYPSLTEAIGNGVFEIKQNSLPPRNR